MEQYLTLTRENQAPGVIKHAIANNVNFEIKSFMRELRENTFSGNKNDDAHEHVERVLDIVNLFNMLGVTQADLGASVNIMSYSMFKCLKLTSRKEIIMLVEMANMSKKAPMGIVENVLVKIDKFVFPYDFVIIDMLGDPNEAMILDRPFLATIHAQINVFFGEILLGIREDRI
nr:hypothetical protein [Tanacetum cinerariifolium]